jgi:hypothetical protein
MPDNGSIVLWDRKYKAPVFTLHAAYAQAVCLELADRAPFSNMEDWFNNLSRAAPESENLPV